MRSARSGGSPAAVLVVPGHALILLIGPPGAGKSTFAARHFRPTEILSSDAFRAMVADDEADQRATPAAFELLHRAAAHRLARARLTVADATNLKPGDRRALLRLAEAARRPAVAILFALPEAVIQAHNRARPGRMVDPAVVARGSVLTARLAERPGALLAEGFRAVHVLRDGAAIDRLRVAREGRQRRAPSASATTLTAPGARSDAPPARTS